jgi:hypothetical protein
LPASLFLAFCLAYTISFLVNLPTDVPEYEWATGRFAPGVRSATKVLWLLGNVAIALVIANAVHRTGSERRSIQSVAVGAVLVGIYGLYQVIGETHGFFVALLPGTDFIAGSPSYWIVLRAKSTFLEPSFFGGYLAAALPFVAVGWLRNTGHAVSGKGITVLMLTIAVAAILVTFAIGGWLPAGVGALSLVVLAGRSGMKGVIVRFGLAALIALIVAFIAIPDLPRAMSVLLYKGALGVGVVTSQSDDPGQQSASPDASTPPGFEDLPPEVAAITGAERSATTRAALNMFASSPVLGVGPGNFGLRYAEFKPGDVAEPSQLLVPNNIYAELLAEVGLLGFLTFVGAFIGLAVLAFNGYRREEGGNRWQVAASLAAMAAMATYFLLGPTFTLLYQWALLGLTGALVTRSLTWGDS